MILERLEGAGGRGTCVGLDPHPSLLPDVIRAALDDPEAALRVWGCEVLDAIAPHTACVKPQVAMYERFGSPGLAALQATCAYARRLGVPVLLDAKRGDIGSTAEAYAVATLDDDGPIGADAVTLSPYLGPESLAPFVRRAEAGKMLFLLLRTSNPGAHTWQDAVAPSIAAWVAEQNHRIGVPRIGVVIGATVDEPWRAALADTWFLMPGIGEQGAAPADVRHQCRADGGGVLPTASRSVLFGPTTPGVPWQPQVAERAAGFAAAWSACYQESP